MNSPDATDPGLKLTYDDFLLFPDDGRRHELIDGEHYVTPSPNTKHQAVSGNLHFMLRAWLEQHPVGRVFYAPFDIVFTQFDVVEPDLLDMSNGSRGGNTHAEARDWRTGDHRRDRLAVAPASATRRSSAACTNARELPSTGSWIPSSR